MPSPAFSMEVKMQIKTEDEFWDFLDSVKDSSKTDDLPSRFIWHYRQEPEVFSMFESFAMQMFRANRIKGSAWLIANRMRWETSISTNTEPFKITNDFISLYARLFMARHPHTLGFFRTGEMKRIKGI